MNFEIETDRLQLRPPRADDAPRVTELIGEWDVINMLGRAPWPYQLGDAENWITRMELARDEGTEYAFLAEHADDGVIAASGLNLVDKDRAIWEIGYWVGKPYWGRGFVTEAARGVLDWATKEAGISAFVSGHIIDNPASGRVLEKLGFEVAGELTMYVRGRDCDVSAIRYVKGAPVDAALQAVAH